MSLGAMNFCLVWNLVILVFFVLYIGQSKTNADDVTHLDSSNFETTVLQNPNQAWAVEFYKGWCKHRPQTNKRKRCIPYSYVWKALSRSINNWKDIVAVAVVDCTSKSNLELCREYKAKSWRNARFFPPNSPPGFHGDKLKLSFYATGLRHNVITAMERAVALDKGAPSWPDLRETRDLDAALSKLAPEVKFVAVVFTDTTSYVGPELILDFHDVKDLKVLYIDETNDKYVTQFQIKHYPSLFVKQVGSDFVYLDVKGSSREAYFYAMKDFLKTHAETSPAFLTAVQHFLQSQVETVVVG